MIHGTVEAIGYPNSNSPSKKSSSNASLRIAINTLGEMHGRLACSTTRWPATLILKLSFRRCVIAELFCEGNPLFDLSQLLAYKNGDYSPEAKLHKIDNNIKVRGYCPHTFMICMTRAVLFVVTSVISHHLLQIL